MVLLVREWDLTNKIEYLEFRSNEIYLFKLTNRIKIGTDWSENELR